MEDKISQDVKDLQMDNELPDCMSTLDALCLVMAKFNNGTHRLCIDSNSELLKGVKNE